MRSLISEYMCMLVPHATDEEITAQRHRDTLTRQRLANAQKRQLIIDAMPKEEHEEFELAIATLKKSFLAVTRTNTGDGSEGRLQALAVRALKNVMPDDVLSLYHKDISAYNKMVILANEQLLLDQQAAEEQDPKYAGPNLGVHDFETTFNAKEAVKRKLQEFPDRRAYIAAYQKVEEEIHNMVTPPYNSKYYNFDKLQRMKDGLESIPPKTLVRWAKKYQIDDIALMCDVATLGLQADFADHLAKQPVKKTAAIVLAGAAATTQATHPQKPALSIGLAAVAGLLAFASLIKHMHMKSFAKQARKNRQTQIDLYGLRPIAYDLKANPLPSATTRMEQVVCNGTIKKKCEQHQK